jgi:hypothetical protein
VLGPTRRETPSGIPRPVVGVVYTLSETAKLLLSFSRAFPSYLVPTPLVPLSPGNVETLKKRHIGELVLNDLLHGAAMLVLWLLLSSFPFPLSLAHFLPFQLFARERAPTGCAYFAIPLVRAYTLAYPARVRSHWFGRAIVRARASSIP